MREIVQVALACVIYFIFGCAAPVPEDPPEGLAVMADTGFNGRPAYSELEATLKKMGLVNVRNLDKTILVDLKYSGTDNFLNLDVYGDMQAAFLVPDVARKLVTAQKLLKDLHPGFSLIVFDAARPLSLQKVFWDSIKVPPAEKGRFVAYPGNGGSLHNYGAAVDAGIVDSTGKELDMGCDFDFFGELSYPSLEQKFLASGELTASQVNNRKLLRQVMSKAGFWSIQTEWWHFVSCSREQAMVLYQLIE